LLGIETAHSPNAQDIATIFWVMLALAAILVIAVNVVLIALLVRYRASRGRQPNRFRGRPAVHARTAAALSALAFAIFIAGIVYTDKADNAAGSSGGAAASSPLHIHAVAQQWIWRYEYPAQESSTAQSASSPVAASTQAFADVFSYYELVVPVDTTVDLDIESTDVMHRWWVPALGGKFDAIPGHTNHTSFRADEEGVYNGASTAFSGASYAAMRTRVRVVSADQYQAWVTQQAADIKAAQTRVQQQLASGGPPGITASEQLSEKTGQ
jgi:cytochrome c oxidase subunit 2